MSLIEILLAAVVILLVGIMYSINRLKDSQVEGQKEIVSQLKKS